MNPEFAKKASSSNFVLGKTSKCQLKLYRFIKEIFPSAILEYPIPRNGRNMYLDIAIVEDKIDFEYDSISYHKNRGEHNYEEHDKLRDEYLHGLGWTVLRIGEKELRTFVS